MQTETHIMKMPDGWWLLTDGRDFGPYENQAGAERCRETYEAFVVNAPTCHHCKA